MRESKDRSVVRDDRIGRTENLVNLLAARRIDAVLVKLSVNTVDRLRIDFPHVRMRIADGAILKRRPAHVGRGSTSAATKTITGSHLGRLTTIPRILKTKAVKTSKADRVAIRTSVILTSEAPERRTPKMSIEAKKS